MKPFDIDSVSVLLKKLYSFYNIQHIPKIIKTQLSNYLKFILMQRISVTTYFEFFIFKKNMKLTL